jgi:hypothetical protein
MEKKLIKIPVTCEEWFMSSYIKANPNYQETSVKTMKIIHKPILHFDIPNSLQSNNYNKNPSYLYMTSGTIHLYNSTLYTYTAIYK